jgi:hypothetical protein
MVQRALTSPPAGITLTPEPPAMARQLSCDQAGATARAGAVANIIFDGSADSIGKFAAVPLVQHLMRANLSVDVLAD